MRDLHERRIKSIGIKIPESIQQKIKAYLQRNADATDGPAETGDG
ncbi:MAG: hypothetical protein ABFD75_10560 [Smithella sp.]